MWCVYIIVGCGYHNVHVEQVCGIKHDQMLYNYIYIILNILIHTAAMHSCIVVDVLLMQLCIIKTNKQEIGGEIITK